MLVVSGLCAGSYKAGRDHKENEMRAQIQRETEIIAGIQLTVADQISKIEVKHVTVRQQLETQILEKPVYRDCVADDRVFELTNSAIVGTDAPADRSVSGTGPDDGQDVR